jgi:mono/diheme cytochrome c family protein
VTAVLTATELLTTTAAPSAVTATGELTATTALTATDVLTETEGMTPAGESSGGAGLPAGFVDLVSAALPARGQQLTVANACIACHAVDPQTTMVGPTWGQLAITAETRVAGLSATEYLYQSITQPNAHLVEGYVAGLMPQTYAESIPEADLATIVAYLLTLTE